MGAKQHSNTTLTGDWMWSTCTRCVCISQLSVSLWLPGMRLWPWLQRRRVDRILTCPSRLQARGWRWVLNTAATRETLRTDSCVHGKMLVINAASPRNLGLYPKILELSVLKVWQILICCHMEEADQSYVLLGASHLSWLFWQFWMLFTVETIW